MPIFVKPGENKTFGLSLHQKYPQFEFIILMASRLTKEKNFLLALKSFAKAKQEITKKSGLVIVGSGQEKEKIKQIIKELKLMNDVVIEPWVENLSAYYQTADLFLLTSNYEGYGRTLIESAEAGCPVLTTNIGLVGEIITKENGLTCSVGDHECLTEKIIWATNNIEKLKILANQLKNDLATKILLDKTEYLKKYKESLSVY